MPWKRSTRTEIVHIVVTGYKKKKIPSKYYVFVIDVTWNNSERFEVYRRYSDFFSFQTMLKALFPGAAGRIINEERVIPQLPKRIFVGRSHVAKVAEARLEQINRYCQTLISLDPKLSESAHVVGFFSPRTGDKELPKLHLHRPASLHPEKIPLGSMFEEHCALAEYVAEDTSQVSFRSGDKVLVMSKDESGWWMCGVDGMVGWAPPSYLKKCEEKLDNDSDESDEDYTGDTQKDKDSDDSGVGDNSPRTPASSIDPLKNFVAPEITAVPYRAIDSYQANGAGQISFEIGDTIHVLDKLEDGWWFVSNGREEGWAPCSYLEGDKEEEVVTNLEAAEKYYTVDNYQAEEEDEISFKRGATVDVLQKSLDGWWVVKLDKVVGLAPATFLKKVEDPTQSLDQRKFLSPSSSSSSSSSSPSPLSSISSSSSSSSSPSPLSSISSSSSFNSTPLMFPAFQQPPRKKSVRARASRHGAGGGRGGRNKPSSLLSPLPPIPADRPYAPQSPNGRKRPPSEAQKKEPLPSPRSKRSVTKASTPSPDLSDSDSEQDYLNFSFQQFAVDQQPAAARMRAVSKSSSESSLSTSSVGGGEAAKPPVATPRKKSPKTNSRTQSTREEMPPSRPPLPPKDKPLPPLPPRPVSSIPQIVQPSAPQIVQPSAEPSRPKQRPRKSEIIRAKKLARAGKGAPSLTVVDEDGLETMSTTSGSSRSSKSSNGNISSKSTPVEVTHVHKRRTATTTSDTRLLAPVPDRQRQRRRSANDEEVFSIPQSSVLSSSLPESMNTEVADTLLKYIMKSEDPGLKAALRELITKDPQITGSIHGSDQ